MENKPGQAGYITFFFEEPECFTSWVKISIPDNSIVPSKGDSMCV